MNISRLLTATALASASLALPQAAFAQDIPPADQTADDAATGESIIVTGSRIRRPEVEANVPVTTITAEDIFSQGQTNLGDTLNDLPQLRSTFAQQNPGAGVGIVGLNLLDLRGLGTQRTLVLVNGRRHVAADILNNASSPDVNTIPNDLIERVDIVTGGSSAVYGSDAIAGVVNFILRRDFDGAQIRGQAALSEKGYGGNQYISGMVGKNFADGRGNVTLHAEYAHQQRVYASDIDWLRTNSTFATIDVDPSGSDGFPDAVIVQDLRSATNHRFGLAAIPQPQGAGARCGAGTLSNNGPTNAAGTSFHCNYIFTDAGRLVAQTGTRFGTGPGGTFSGGNGQTGREGTQLSILPYMQRINTNLLARYEFSEAAEFFLEGKFARIDAVGNQLGPTFLNNTTSSLGADDRINPRLDNPFLNPADRATLASSILASGCGFTRGTAIGTVTCRPLTAAEQTAIADGSYRFLFARSLTDSPDRDEVFRRETYRVVGGLRGTFNGDWNYEISANYGRMDETADMRGFVDRQRFLLSLDAGRNPVTGAIQCRSQFDPASAAGLSGNPDAAAKLASDIAACVPYNPFGAGNNAAAVDYFKYDILNRARMEQLNFLGFIGGDLSQLFTLPGGPVSFVIGGEYREEKAFNDSDAAADNGLSNSVFLGDVSARMSVKEAFGEIRVPLLADVPFFRELTVSGAGRVSDYDSAVGTVYAYNAGVEWAPFSSLRFRANYGRSVRAPNVSESSFPSVPNFANGFIDPCSRDAIGNNANRPANCAAALTPAQLAALPNGGYSLGIISGSNPNLREETADSYTIGAVFQPTFAPGLSLTVDYYDITVNDVIVSLAAQTIANSCYDTPGGASPLCGAFQRNLTGSTGPNGEAPGAILAYSLVSGPQNFAKRVRRGMDFNLAYRTSFNEDVRFGTRLIYSHQFQNSNFENPTLPDFENRLLSELGDPQDEFRWDVDLSVNNVTFGYQMRYIGPMLTSTYENYFPLNGQAPLNADAFDIMEYPAVVYHDFRIDFRVGERSESAQGLNFFVGVDNFTDQRPPFGSNATGVGSAIYNIRGRNFYAGARARF